MLQLEERLKSVYPLPPTGNLSMPEGTIPFIYILESSGGIEGTFRKKLHLLRFMQQDEDMYADETGRVYIVWFHVDGELETTTHFADWFYHGGIKEE